jgi:hypothetical protein
MLSVCYIVVCSPFLFYLILFISHINTNFWHLSSPDREEIYYQLSYVELSEGWRGMRPPNFFFKTSISMKNFRRFIIIIV